MSVLSDMGAVNISGAVGSMLSTYQQILLRYLDEVTGDPATLRSLAAEYADQASVIEEVSNDTEDQATGLGSAWNGLAYDAYDSFTEQLTTDLDELALVAITESTRLSEAATALSTAESAMQEIISEFQQTAQTLTSEAGDASAAAIDAFFEAAQSLGDSAIEAAAQIASYLDTTLSTIFGLEPEPSGEAGGQGEQPGGEATADGAGGEGGEGGENEPIKPPNAVDAEKTEALAALLDTPFGQSMWKTLTGKPFDPSSLSGGPLNELDDLTRRFNGINGASFDEEADPSLAKSLGKATDVTLWEGPTSTLYANTLTYGDKDASLSLGPQLTNSDELSIEGGQLKFSDTLKGTIWDAQANGTGGLGNYNLDAYTGSSLNGYLSANNTGVTAGGDARLALLDVNGQGTLDVGGVALQGKFDGYAGADANGLVQANASGVAVQGQAFAGAQITANQNIDVGGLGVGLTETGQAGAGIEGGAHFTWNNGDVQLGASVGAAVGLGGAVGVNLDVNLPKIGNELEQIFSSENIQRVIDNGFIGYGD
jgi:uncharacterized protein YukE